MDLLPRDIQCLICSYITYCQDLQSLRLVCRRFRDILPDAVTGVSFGYTQETGLPYFSGAGLNWLTQCNHIQDLDFADVKLGTMISAENFLKLSGLPLRRIAMENIGLLIPFLLAYRQAHKIGGRMSQLRFNDRKKYRINTYNCGIPSFDGKTLICQASLHDTMEWDLISNIAEILLDLIDFEYIIYDDLLRECFYRKLFASHLRPGMNAVQGTLFAFRFGTDDDDDIRARRDERFGAFMMNHTDLQIHRVAGVYEPGQLSLQIRGGVTELLQTIPIDDLENAIEEHPLVNKFIVEVGLSERGVLKNAIQSAKESLSRHSSIELIIICIRVAHIYTDPMSIRDEIISTKREHRIRFIEGFDIINTFGKSYELPGEACRMTFQDIERSSAN